MLETWRAYLRALSARQWALVGAVLLCAVSGAYVLWRDTAEPVILVQQETVPPPATEIKGLSAAALKVPLRNPFSAAHERVGEIPHTSDQIDINAAAVPPAVMPPANVPSPLPPAALAAAVPAAAASPPPLVLRGVVMGADGARLAILAQGEAGAALGIGETWKEYTLRSVTDQSATLENKSGTITLTRE
ncbi:MAG: hypothetical protein ACFNLO_04715 [Selenomonas massiliensis]